MSTPINTQRAITRFRDEVYSARTIIDPESNHDWHDIALGFFLACGVPREALTWTFLTDMANGNFDAHLGLPKDAPEWVQTFFDNNPEAVTVRLGYGWGLTPDSGPEVWLDAVNSHGDHWSPNSKYVHLTIPSTVIEWVKTNIPLGEFRDYFRPPT